MSKLINKTRLTKFANDFWTKIKDRYDDAFIDAAIPTEAKKITFTKRKNGATKDVSLEDYARLQDKNDFKKDVSSNIGMTDNTLKYGRLNGNANPNRTSGHRGVTSKSFVDGYIDHIVVLADVTQAVGESSRWNVWAVTKGETRDADRVLKKIDVTATIITQTINGVEEKAVNLPIKDVFTNETYFLVRCEGKQYKVVNVNAENQTDDVVNISEVPNETTAQIPWGTNVKDNIAVMFLVGRESIKSLSEKLDKVSSDSSTYVKHSECTVQGGQANANKVVKLDGQGKLNKDMLPSIAVNDYFSVTAFTDEKLGALTYENGDVVVVENGGVVSKRYLCIHKGATNSTTEFVELNSKDGVVQSVDGKVGAVVLNLEATENSLKLKIGNGSGTDVEKSVDIISDTDINTIINGLN